MASRNPVRLLSDEPRVTVLAVPVPAWIEIEPESTSLVLGIEVRVPFEFTVLVASEPE